MKKTNKKVGVNLHTKFIEQLGDQSQSVDKEFTVFKAENNQGCEWTVGYIGIKRTDVENLITEGNPSYDMALANLPDADQDTKEMVAAGVIFLEKLYGSKYLGLELLGECFEATTDFLDKE